MSLFQYIAINESNKKVKGIIDASYRLEAKQILIDKNYTLLDIYPLKINSITKNISSSEILQFTREIAKLLSASLPLYDALISLEEKYRNKKIHPVILCLCDRIKSGSSMSQTLAEFPSIFDILYCSIVSNAERTGSLDSAFNELTQILSNQQSIKKKVINTLTYPSILVVFCLCVLMSLFFFVIPSLSELFEGRDIHFFTRVILSISCWLNEKKILFFSLLIAVFSTFFLFSLTKKFKKIFQIIILKLPLIGNILQKLAIIRFSRSFSTLLDGGVSFIYAFQDATKVMKHAYLEKCFKEIEQKILEGASFASELEKITLLPSFMIRMIAISEKSGNLPFILKQIAEIEEEDLSRNLNQLTSILQPIILLFLGLIVGLVLLAVLIPLTDVSSFINY
jgi:general secretion pathway protein F